MKKVTILAMVLVLCVSALGIGYAMWSEKIDIDATVNTGNLDVGMTVVDAYDNEAEGKNVSGVEAWVDEDGSIEIEVNGAYPCITYTVVVEVTSLGTVPVHFTDWAMSGELVDMGAVTVDSLYGLQLHQGDSALVIVTIHLTNEMLNELPNAGMLSQFGMHLEALAVQYNELPYVS